MEKQERRNSNRFLVVTTIILLIIVGILLWLLLVPTNNPERIPTGRVDEFNIRIGVPCRDENDPDCRNDEDNYIPYVTPGRRRANGNEEKKVNGKTDTEVQREGIIYVDDKSGRYVYQKTLKIFENPAFEYTNKIAPGVSNSYDFKVHNETENTIRYNIEFSEESEYAIFMRYRLKRAGKYVVGSDSKWVGANELVSALKELPIDGVDAYTLDWEWPYESGRDELDTEIGEKMTSEYCLKIKINFEEA